MEWELVEGNSLTREAELFKHFFDSLPTDGDWTVIQPPDAPVAEEPQSSATRRIEWLAVVDSVLGRIDVPDEKSLASLPPEVVSQIKKDLDRSYPEIPVLNFKNRLDLLLKRYAVRNPTVGYCQGLSFIGTALLQEDFSDREVFRVFSFLLEHVVTDFHLPSLAGLHHSVAQIRHILQRDHSEFLAHIDRLDVPLLWLAVEPLMTLWSRKFPLFAIRKIWTSLFFPPSKDAVVSFFVAMLIACRQEFVENRKNMEIVVAVHKRMQSVASDVKALKEVIAHSKEIVNKFYICSFFKASRLTRRLFESVKFGGASRLTRNQGTRNQQQNKRTKLTNKK